jgi:hypothetical protein
MSLTALRRQAAVVAVVATTAGLAAVPALHADAATQARSSISIRLAHAVMKPGGTDRVLGNLAVAGAATGGGRTVSLEARPAGTDGFVPVGTTTSGPKGGLALTVAPQVTTHYRWAFAGDTDARPSRSGIATIRVRTPQHAPTRIRTTLSIRAVRHLVALDGTDVVRGRLLSGRVPLRHRQVLLLSRPVGGDTWALEGAHLTRRDGGVRFRVQPDADSAYQLVFLGTALLRPSRSGIVRVLTRADVTITADPTRIDRGGSSTISGVASDAGTPYVGATVQLLAGKAGRHRVTVAGSTTTADDGSVSFTVSPRVTTVYRLRLVHATGIPTSLSGPARVAVRIPSSLSIRGRATATDYVVSGTLRAAGHPLDKRVVTLWSQAPGSTDWVEVGTATTGRYGVVRFHEATAPGTGYRLAFAGGPRFAPSSSGTVVS